jgi:hypothetical protein
LEPSENRTDSLRINSTGRLERCRLGGVLYIFLVSCFFFPQVSSAQVPLHPDRGVCLIWYGSQDNLDHRGGIVTGGQVMMMWRDFEPSEGAYQFGPIDDALAKAKAKGIKITVQINGNFHPDYIFETVPYLKGVALNGQKDHTIGYGPPMYWHEEYKNKYAAMITSLARHLLQSPDRESILGIRQSYCAIGTENYYLAPEYRSQVLWTRHETAAWGGPWPWTAEIGHDYKTWAIDLFVDQFYPPDSIPVFMRASAISDGVASADHVRMVEEGKLWIFHTSSEPQPRNDGKNNQYQQFVNYCKTGKTYGFMESWSKATTSSSGWEWTKTARPIDLTQFNYWTLLCDLHCGATFPVMRPEAVDFAPFRSDYEFARKYAGYIASPYYTPGAWIAFREGDFLKGDYTFLMQRDPAYPSQALYNLDNDRRGLWARKVPAGGTMRVMIDPDFIRSLAGTEKVGLIIWYRDEGTGYFEAEVSGQVFRCYLEDSRTWRRFTRELIVPEDDPEIRIVAEGGPLTLHMVEFLRGMDQSADTSFMLSVRTDGTPGAVIQNAGRYLVFKDSSSILSVTTTPEGYRFDRWTVLEGDALIAGNDSQNTTVRLTRGSAVIEAQFVPALNTHSASASGGMENVPVSMWHDPANRRVVFGFGRVTPAVNLRVYRLDGCLVRERMLDQAESIEVDLSGLKPGMHLVRLSFGGNFPDICRFVAQPG